MFLRAAVRRCVTVTQSSPFNSSLISTSASLLVKQPRKQYCSLKAQEITEEVHVAPSNMIIDQTKLLNRLEKATENFNRSEGEKDIRLYTRLMDINALLGNISESERLFEETKKRPALTKEYMGYTTMIRCYSQVDRMRDALRVFREVESTGLVIFPLYKELIEGFVKVGNFKLAYAYYLILTELDQSIVSQYYSPLATETGKSIESLRQYDEGAIVKSLFYGLVKHDIPDKFQIGKALYQHCTDRELPLYQHPNALVYMKLMGLPEYIIY